MVKETYIQFCPICGSKHFSFFKENKTSEVASAGMYQCNRCKNIFAFPIELPIRQAKKVKEVPLTPQLIRDTPQTALMGLGNVEVYVYWKILGIAIVLIGLFLIIASTMPIHCYQQEGITICNANTNPRGFIITGAALASAGLFLLLETFVILKSDEKTKRLLRIGLVLALTIIISILGISHLAVFSSS